VELKMKKKQLIILSVIAVAVIAIISIFYYPVEESESTGTVGKVEKYRSNATGQEKILLRNELLQDSSALKNVIISLQMYENFTNTLADNFDEWSTTLKKINLKEKNLAEQLKALDDLKIFVENNIEKVTNTKVLLLKYLVKDTLDRSIDIDNNLIEFSSFVENFDKKATAVDDLFKNLNGIIKDENLAMLSLTKKEAESLKEVREKMLGGIIFTAITMNNSDRLNAAMGSTVMNIVALNRQLNNNLIGLFVSSNANKSLGSFSNAKLESALLGLMPVMAKDKLAALNKEQLNVGFFNKELLSGIELESNVIGNYAAAFNNKTLGAVFNTSELGVIIKNNEYVFSKENLGMNSKDQLGMLAKENLGTALFSNEGLKIIANYAQTFNAFNLGNMESMGLKEIWVD